MKNKIAILSVIVLLTASCKNAEKKVDTFLITQETRQYMYDDEQLTDTISFRYDDQNRLIYFHEQDFDGERGVDSILYNEKGQVSSFIHIIDGEPVFGQITHCRVEYGKDVIFIHTASRPLYAESAAENDVDTTTHYGTDTLLIKNERVVERKGFSGRDYQYNGNGDYIDEAFGADTTFANPYALAASPLIWTILLDEPVYGNPFLTRYTDVYDAATVTPYTSQEGENNKVKYPGSEKLTSNGSDQVNRYFYEVKKK